MAFGFVGIYDQDEAERILENQVTDMGEHRVITLREPSDQAKKVSQKLIQRAEKANGAWNAALDYAGEHFEGADLAFVTTEIRTAEARWKAVHTPLLSETLEESAAAIAFANARDLLGIKAA